jgi:hypothetical protein
MAAEWTSLEVAKLLVGVLTPLVVVALGIMVRNAARRIEDAQWASRKLVERRIELYDQMAGPLNDLFVFFLRVGQFREINPSVAIRRKRALDKAFYTNRFLMSEAFSERYHSFIDACFVEGQYMGRDAKLRASWQTQKAEWGDETRWNDEWNGLFVTQAKDVVAQTEVESTYDALMERFAAECGVTPLADAP